MATKTAWAWIVGFEDDYGRSELVHVHTTWKWRWWAKLKASISARKWPGWIDGVTGPMPSTWEE